ncbi:MAG: DUF87 domain-containing protein [Chloroflexi bacterium]|uniref:DUF87 domain-containing protein n=1 Tax=Candidatus Chlorohelix allophototropha TaxID=3003348 RepID=A0A8T7M0F2_9CHLR|nr:DUF87 domain-containing protein [Chloroflexota bacterium]WJW67165.1 DUF87 domain-containing protein [Chloroflexota bacterium L227-S17]
MEIITAIVLLTPLILAIAAFGAYFYQTNANESHKRHLEKLHANALVTTLQPDNNGNYPVRILQTGAILHPQAGNILQPVPNTLHYSPHVIVKGSHSVTDGSQIASLPTSNQFVSLQEPVKIPTFADLLRTGEIEEGLILGYKPSGEPIKGTWKDLYSSNVAGVSGSGKTTTVRFLASQSALQGAKFLIIDPHGDSGEESLASTLEPLNSSFFYGCKPAIAPDEIEAVLDIISRELQSRLHNRENRNPLILAIDEFTSLYRTSMGELVAKLLQDISQQGRKVNIFALVVGQIWKGSTSGGTELRDSFASSFVHRMKANQARLLLPTEEARAVQSFQAGEAFLYRTNGVIELVKIPLTTSQDVIKVASIAAFQASNRLTSDFQTAEILPPINDNWKSNISQLEVINNQASSPLQSVKAISPDDARVVSMFLDGKTISDIVKALHGEVAGRNLQAKNTEVQEVLRRNFKPSFDNNHCH